MAFKSTCQTLKKVGDDEPIFVLRAQDVTASRTLAFWLAINKDYIPKEKYEEALKCHLAMIEWPNKRRAD